jgi:hypothetical protein
MANQASCIFSGVFGNFRDKGKKLVELGGLHPLNTPYLPHRHGNSQRTFFCVVREH